MIIQFKTLVSSSIKRKKPWAQVSWIGSVKESVCLFDKNRISILYLPSGKTRKGISPLQPYKKDVVCFNISSSGEFIVALLTSGQIIRWHKDSGSVVKVEQCPGILIGGGKDSSKLLIFINNAGDKIILIVGNKVNVWDAGVWSAVGLGQFGASPLGREASIDVMFFTNEDQGRCCLCTIVSNQGNKISLFCLFLRWMGPPGPGTGFVSSISHHTYPLQCVHPSCRPVRLRGAYVSCISHDGQTLAAAVNQRHPCQSNLMFIHPYTASSVVVDLKRLGSKPDQVLRQFAKTYWIAQMSWTSDDLFIACVTRRGSLLLVSKLGEPIKIVSEGSKVDFGPAHFLPLHPLVEHGRNKPENVLSNNTNDAESLASTIISEKSTRQKFSVATHPRLPIILCSDGYSVTALQMTEFVRSRDLATFSLVEINRDLKSTNKKFNLQVPQQTTPRFELPPIINETAKFKENRLTLFYASLRKRFTGKRKIPESKSPEKLNEESFSRNEEIDMLAYRFEEEEQDTIQEEDTDNEIDSRAPPGVIIGADSGKISFADLEETIQTDEENLPLDGESLCKLISACTSHLLSVYGLIVCEPSSHITPMDDLHHFFVQTLRCLCATILQAQQVSYCLVWRLDSSNEHGNSPVPRILNDLLVSIPKRLCLISSWSALYRPVVVKSITTAIETILTSPRTSPEGCLTVEDVSKNIVSVFVTMKQCERHLDIVHNYHLSPFLLVDNRHVTDCYFHPLDVSRFESSNENAELSSHRLMLWPAWKKFYSFLTKLWNMDQCQQILPSIARILATVQKIVLPRSCDLELDPYERSTTFNSMRANLCEYKLDKALKLASHILDDHLVAGSKWNGSNWAAVELLCQVMADYFKNRSLVFPANDISKRNQILDREVVTSAIRSQRLSDHWTAEHTMAMLTHVGRLHDASQLAVGVGTWRVGVALGAVAAKVRAYTGSEYNSMEQPLEVIKILKDKFLSLLPDFDKNQEDFDPESLYPAVVDLFTVGVMTGSDLTSWVISYLMDRIKEVIRKSDLLIPEPIHLPTPPLYLPQLASNSEQVERYTSLQHEISSLVRLLLVVFHSMAVTHPLASWYVKHLDSGDSPREDSSVFDSEDWGMVCEAFRQLCALLWSVHAREQLSEATRAYQRAREEGEELESLVHDCFAWLTRLRTFGKFYKWGDGIQDLVLCLASELNVDETLISTISHYFYDPTNISAKIDPKLKVFIQRVRQTPHVVDGADTAQPMTVVYQRECSVRYQERKVDTSIEHMFVRRVENLNRSNGIEYFVPEFTQDYKSSQQAVFPFEKDQCFHEFISKMFEVILSKADSMQRSGRKKKQSFQNVLMLCNRNKVASAELELALSIQTQQKQFSKVADLSKNSPDRTSTPKVRKSSSFTEVSKSVARKIKFKDDLTSNVQLHRYFSEPDLNDNFETDLDIKLPSFEISKTPHWIRKRLLRLSPYFNWLEVWSKKAVPGLESKQAAIAINITKHQMLQGLTVAEMRFGKAPKQVPRKKPVLPPLKIVSVAMETDDDVTTVSSIESLASVNQTLAVNQTPVASQAPAVNQTEENESEDQLIRTDQSDPTTEPILKDNEPIKTDAELIPEDSDVIEDKIEKDSEKDKPLVMEDLKEEESKGTSTDAEESCSALADGGGTYRIQDQPLGGTKDAGRSNNVADVVRSEIHNVLLAQQVSLLSQILLGQTLTGGSQVGGNPLVDNVLKSLLPAAPSVAKTEPKSEKIKPKAKPCEETREEPHDIHENIESYEKPHGPVNHITSMKAKRRDYGIPLFHVPGITKSHEPKSVSFVPTPKSSTSWRASLAARQTYDGGHSGKPPKLINLNNRNKPVLANNLPQQTPPTYQPTAPSHPPQQGIPHAPPYESPNDPPNPVILKPPIKQHQPAAYTPQIQGPAAKQPFKTNYPILQPPNQAPIYSNPPNVTQSHTNAATQKFRPASHFNQPREAWVEGNSPKPMFINCQPPKVPRQYGHREIIPRLINPQEVLAYECRKQGFTDIRKPSSTSRQPKVPLMKIVAPPFEHTHLQTKPVEKSHSAPNMTPEVRKTTPDAHKTIQLDKENVDPTKDDAAEPKEEFQGYLDQEEVAKQLEIEMLGSDEKMTQADVHFVSAVGKNQHPRKPRMKDADTQMEVEEVSDDTDDQSDADYRDQMKSKPLQPPPDIFLKMRLDQEKPLVAAEGFIHVGEVSKESVKRGIEPKSVAEMHYEATHNATPNNPGFNDLDAHAMMSQHIQSVTKINSVREITHSRWRSSMEHMDAQLSAMDVMARRMGDDFKSSHRLVQTIDDMGEMIAPTNVHKSQPSKPLEPIQEQPYKDQPSEHHPTPVYNQPKRSAPDYNQPSYQPSTRFQPDPMLPVSRPSVTPYQEVTGGYHRRLDEKYKSRLNEAFELTGTAPPSIQSRSSHSATDSPVTSQRISDVISDVSSDILIDEAEPAEYPLDDDKEYPQELTSHQVDIEALIDDGVADQPIKSWKHRSASEKQDVRRWMLQKKRERSSEYNSYIRNLRGNEKKPFQSSSAVRSKDIVEFTRRMEKRKRDMLLEHNQQRKKESMKLYGEIKTDNIKVKELQQKSPPSKGIKSRRSPLKEANGRLDSTYRITPRSTPYKKSITPYKKTSTPNRRIKKFSPPSLEHIEDDTSDNLSIISTWKLSDDVKKILYGSSTLKKHKKPHVTFDMRSNVSDDMLMTSHDMLMTTKDMLMTSQVNDVDSSSRDTESLLADVDWKDVDDLVASVEQFD